MRVVKLGMGMSRRRGGIEGRLPTYGRQITAAELARRVGLRRRTVEQYCLEGRFKGAWFDPLTWQWWIPLPVVARR